MESKTCSACGQQKPLNQDHWYYARGRAVHICKICHNAKSKVRYSKNKEVQLAKVREKRNANIEFVREKERIYGETYRTRNRERINARNKERYVENPEVFSERIRRYKEGNPERYAELRRVADKRRRERDIETAREKKRAHARKRASRIDVVLGNTIRSALHFHLRRNKAKKMRQSKLITGWTIPELMTHLEVLFEDGMSFANYGDWHIDHIIPVSAVKFTDENDPIFRMIWALPNLAPLWAKDNLSKTSNVKWQLPDHYKNPKLRTLYENRDESLLVFG